MNNEEDTPHMFKQFRKDNAAYIAWNIMGHLRSTAIGTVVLLLNGTIGVTLEQFAELRKRTHKCSSCLCYFSWDGYQQHIEYDMVCKNTPSFEPGNLIYSFDASYTESVLS